MSKLIRSAIGLVSGLWLWFKGSNTVVARSRMRICRPCQYRKGVRCGECGCLLLAKTRLPDEECPRNKW